MSPRVRPKANKLKGGTIKRRYIFHHYAKTRAKLKTHVTQEKSSSWTCTPRKRGDRGKRGATHGPGSCTLVPSKPEAEEEVPPQEVRPVMTRGSVIKVNFTRLAALGTRSLGLQTASLTATRSVATQTAIFTTNMGSLHHSEADRIELQRLQHHISQTIAQTGGQDQKTTELQYTTALQGCIFEAALGFVCTVGLARTSHQRQEACSPTSIDKGDREASLALGLELGIAPSHFAATCWSSSLRKNRSTGVQERELGAIVTGHEEPLSFMWRYD